MKNDVVFNNIGNLHNLFFAHITKDLFLTSPQTLSTSTQAVLTEVYDDDHAGVYVSRNNHLEKAFLTATRASFASFEASVAGLWLLVMVVLV